MQFNIWSIVTSVTYLLGAYFFLLRCYQVLIPVRRFANQVAKLRALLAKYIPPTA